VGGGRFCFKIQEERLTIRHTHKITKDGKVKVVQTRKKTTLAEKLAVALTGGKKK
jgi:uncharacterized protein YxjI